MTLLEGRNQHKLERTSQDVTEDSLYQQLRKATELQDIDRDLGLFEAKTQQKSDEDAAREDIYESGGEAVQEEEIFPNASKSKRTRKESYKCTDKYTKFGKAVINEFYAHNPDKRRGTSYNEEIKQFALTLYGYSPRSYEFVRRCFNNCLPTSRTICNYYSRIDSEPGVTENSMLMLEQKANEMKSQSKELHVSVAFDEMSIRRHQYLLGKKVTGNIDVGDGIGHAPATQVLVLLATGLNCAFKVPVAYYFINAKLPAEDRKQIIEKTVDSINQTGAIIVNLVCDNSRVNIKTLKLLGMNYTASNPTTDLDLFNCLGKRIFALLDVPHLLKIGKIFRYIFSITKIKPIFLHAIIKYVITSPCTLGIRSTILFCMSNKYCPFLFCMSNKYCRFLFCMSNKNCPFFTVST